MILNCILWHCKWNWNYTPTVRVIIFTVFLTCTLKFVKKWRSFMISFGAVDVIEMLQRSDHDVPSSVTDTISFTSVIFTEVVLTFLIFPISTIPRFPVVFSKGTKSLANITFYRVHSATLEAASPVDGFALNVIPQTYSKHPLRTISFCHCSKRFDPKVPFGEYQWHRRSISFSSVLVHQWASLLITRLLRRIHLIQLFQMASKWKPARDQQALRVHSLRRVLKCWKSWC